MQNENISGESEKRTDKMALQMFTRPSSSILFVHFKFLLRVSEISALRL